MRKKKFFFSKNFFFLLLKQDSMKSAGPDQELPRTKKNAYKYPKKIHYSDTILEMAINKIPPQLEIVHSVDFSVISVKITTSPKISSMMIWETRFLYF